MGPDGGGRASPQARSVAGHLIALVADRDYAALSAELSPLVQSPGNAPRQFLYGCTDLAGHRARGRGHRPPRRSAGWGGLVLEVRTTAGRTVGAGDLPPGPGRVGRSVLALLADDRAAARTHLMAAEREPDPAVRATTLVEALVWLNAMLDAETSAFPDLPPW